MENHTWFYESGTLPHLTIITTILRIRCNLGGGGGGAGDNYGSGGGGGAGGLELEPFTRSTSWTL